MLESGSGSRVVMENITFFFFFNYSYFMVIIIMRMFRFTTLDFLFYNMR